MHHLLTPIKTIIWEELTNNVNSGKRRRRTSKTDKSVATSKETKSIHTNTGRTNGRGNSESGPKNKSGKLSSGDGVRTRGRPKNKN